jgi:hypothetical protein
MVASDALALLVLARHALVKPPTPTPTSVPTGVNVTDPWQIFLAIGAILGAVAALQQLIAAVAKYRRRKEEALLFQVMKDQLDAEHARSQAQTAKQEAATLSEMREVLRKQIEEDVPREARRLYVEHRLSVLGREIAEQYKEYRSLQNELGSEARTQLDRRLAAVIEGTIVPAQVSSRRRERLILALLVAIGLFTFTPFDLQRIFFYYLSQPFFIINNSYRFTEATAGWSIAAIVLIWTSLIFLLAKVRRVRSVATRFIRVPTLVAKTALLVAPGASLMLLVAGFYIIADDRQEYMSIGNYVIQAHWHEANDQASACFNAASFIIGALLAYALLSRLSNRLSALLRKRKIRSSEKSPHDS